jgi:hypothetical protein
MNASHSTATLRSYRLLNWKAVLVDQLKRKFKAASTRGLSAAFSEKLYVQDDKQHSSITLFAGNHPVGNSLCGQGLAVEEGAALTVSQAVDGSVIFILYPFKSELMHRKESKILWGCFKGPNDVTERTIDRAITDAACYWRVSSALDGGSLFDRLRVDYLLLRSQLHEALAKRSRLTNMVKIGSWLTATIAILASITGLAGTSLPQIWNQLYPSTNVGMPVITGWYTFCPEDKTGANPKLLDLLHQIRQNAGKVAFFDVQIDVDCVMGEPFDPHAALSRKADERSLTYSFSNNVESDSNSGMNNVALEQRVPDNGAFVTVLDDRDGRNALTRLGINIEGADDELYGPYLIKASSNDAALSLTLSAPVLDSLMQEAATAIALRRQSAQEKELPAKDLPPVISLSADDLKKLHQFTSLPTTNAVSDIPPLKLPPIPADARLPYPSPLTDDHNNRRSTR